MVGVVLVGIGLGIGIPLYLKFGGAAGGHLDFFVSVTPGADTVSRGDNITVSVDVKSLTGYEGNVDLDATGEPDNVDVSFSPNSGNVPFGSTMTITVGPDARTGTSTITVKGRSEDGVTKEDTFELTIE